MSRRYETLIRILEDQNMSTHDLVNLNKRRMRDDLVGENDVA